MAFKYETILSSFRTILCDLWTVYKSHEWLDDSNLTNKSLTIIRFWYWDAKYLEPNIIHFMVNRFRKYSGDQNDEHLNRGNT